LKKFWTEKKCIGTNVPGQTGYKMAIRILRISTAMRRQKTVFFYKEIKRSEWELCGRYFSSESSHCQLFTNLFSTEVDVTYPDFLAKIDQKVTVAMNERLMAPFLG
jgi:hypothetical protein